MASNIADIRTKVAGTDGKGGRLMDAAGRLGVAVGGPVDQAIDSAREEYQRLRPRQRVVKLNGAGAYDFAIAGLTGFVDGGGTVLQVVYPYVTTQQRPVPLEDDEWQLLRLDTGLVLRLLNVTPQTGEFVLVAYTTPHTLDVAASSIPVTDDEALSDLATCFACLALANYYSQSTDASISADVDDRRTKSDLYRSDAEKWRASWRRKMGLDPGEVVASGVVTEVDRDFQDRARTGYHFHDRRAN